MEIVDASGARVIAAPLTWASCAEQPPLVVGIITVPPLSLPADATPLSICSRITLPKALILSPKTRLAAVSHAQVEIAVRVHAAGKAEVRTAAEETIAVAEHAELEYRNQCHFSGARHADGLGVAENSVAP